MNGFAFGLGLNRRLRATRKWAICLPAESSTHFFSYFLLFSVGRYISDYYYMAGSASGKDEANTMF